MPLKVGSLYQHPEHGVVCITNCRVLFGSFGRLSNHWTARKVKWDGSLGREVSFYGEHLACLDDQYELRFLKKKAAKK